jgi:curved DNA-binding protein CbpA
MVDYYEFLQISPNADPETIHRVYRFLAARFHPDNHQSGNVEMFGKLRVAYDILSDPGRRAEYDTLRRQKPQQPLSFTIDFMDHLDGELNRRLAVLAMLYYRRRRSPNLPEVSLAELEERMGFPRDYLDFTLWYLQKKSYIAKTDSAQYALTAEGVDFVEHERAKIPILDRLLTSGSTSEVETYGASNPHDVEMHVLDSVVATNEPDPVSTAVTLPSSKMETIVDRRTTRKERRTGTADLRSIKVERRSFVADRRRSYSDRRKIN